MQMSSVQMIVWSILLFSCAISPCQAITMSGQGETEIWNTQIECPSQIDDVFIKNGTYSMHDWSVLNDDNYQENDLVKKRKFNEGRSESDDYISDIAYGKLTDSGSIDAAFIISEFDGGHGTAYIVSAIVKYKDGCMLYQAGLSYPPIQVDSIKIKNQHVLVSLRYRGPGEPTCCPTKKGILDFIVGKQGLTLVKGIRFPRVW